MGTPADAAQDLRRRVHVTADAHRDVLRGPKRLDGKCVARARVALDDQTRRCREVAAFAVAGDANEQRCTDRVIGQHDPPAPQQLLERVPRRHRRKSTNGVS